MIAAELAKPFATTFSGQVLIPVISALSVVAALAAIRYIPRWRRESKSWKETVLSRLASQDVKLDMIGHETHMNSGSSMKDAVVRVETKLDAHLTESAANMVRFNTMMDRQPPPPVQAPPS